LTGSPSVDYTIFVVAIIRAIVWMIGAVIALRSRKLFPKANSLIAVGMGMAAFNSIALSLSTSGVVNLPHWIVLGVSLLALPSVMLIVEGLWVRVRGSQEFLRHLEELDSEH
jgi:hypothetical protein